MEQPVVTDLTHPRTAAEAWYAPALLPCRGGRLEEALEQRWLSGSRFFICSVNAETGEINAIYERNHGGAIQPRNGNAHNKNGQIK